MMKPSRTLFLFFLLGQLLIAHQIQNLATTETLDLPSPTYEKVVNLWKKGEAAKALDHLETEIGSLTTPIPVEAEILRATLFGVLKQPEASELHWKKVIDSTLWMRTFARRSIIKSLLLRDKAELAEPFLRDLMRSDPTRHLDLAILVAESHASLGKLKPSSHLYRQVIAQQPKGRLANMARLGLARTLEKQGQLKETLELLTVTKLFHTDPDTFKKANLHQKRLTSEHNANARILTEIEYRNLVRRLRASSSFQLALETIEEWRKSVPLTRQNDLIEYEYIETLYAQRENMMAVSAAENFFQRFPTSGFWADVMLTRFRLAVRMSDTENARELGLNLWQSNLPHTTEKHRRGAGVLLAAYLVAIGDLSGGLDIYRDLFRHSENPDDQRAYLWRAGVAALHDGQHDRAVMNLRALLDRNPTGDLAPAGLYWLAVAETFSDRHSAERRFKTLVKRFPFHYYGLRAKTRLANLVGIESSPNDLSPQSSFPELTLTTQVQTKPEYKAAMALARAGLIEDAAWYLRRLLNRSKGNRGLAFLTARASAQANEHSSVTKILVNHFSTFMQRPARNLPEDFWKLVYPRPFWEQVNTAAVNNNIDPNVLYALMRQESRFDPAARSAVGAIGLFQIMPYTANAFAKNIGIDTVINETSLMLPSINTAIAAKLTSDLSLMFDQDFAPIAASYNAGEDRVKLWWDSASNADEDFFVDLIPYSETRRFVREVLTNYAAYQRIYSEKQ